MTGRRGHVDRIHHFSSAARFFKDLVQGSIVSALRVHGVRRAARSFSRRVRIPRALSQRLPVDGWFKITILGDPFNYRSSLHDGVGRVLFWHDSEDYEPDTFRVLAREMRAAEVFLDVGANTGLFCLMAAAARPEAQVHAFEPSPRVFESLRANIRGNPCSRHVVLNRRAVAARSGATTLHVPSRTWGSASLARAGFEGLPGHLEEVEAVTLDEYVRDAHLPRVDLIKIDVEGFEADVLRGARNVLLTHRPTIVCECLPRADRRTLQCLLEEVRYRPVRLTEHGEMPLKRLDSPGDVTHNFMLLPQERANQRA